TRVESDADIAAMVAVRARTDPDLPPPRPENLRHNLAANPDLTYLVVRLRAEPVACGFVEISDTPYAHAHTVVVQEVRRQGVGSALLAEVSGRAAARGKTALQGEAREDDVQSRGFLEHRGYRVVGGEQAVALHLDAVDQKPVEAPPGVRIVTRADRPDLVEAMYEVSREADEDIPGSDFIRSFQAFRAQDIDRPTRRPGLCFIGLAGDEVVGYALLDDFGADAYHGLTAVKREWRRRGVATALKRTQIKVAKELGFERLVTESEERNLPMRSLNLKLGYRPEPSLSTVVLRGPLLH
ncbi:MAG TPA: GNAT family N-acetyltransferase, partial [Gaiellaceae bacterium]|nr:GNAT family N-acetyltransferase [Gaiellaceae bacterium]